MSDATIASASTKRIGKRSAAHARIGKGAKASGSAVDGRNTIATTAASSTACAAISSGPALTGMGRGSAPSGAIMLTAAACDAATNATVVQKSPPSSSTAAAASTPAVAAPATTAITNRSPARSDDSSNLRPRACRIPAITATSLALATPKASETSGGLPPTVFASAVTTSTSSSTRGRVAPGCSSASSTDSPAAGHQTATVVPMGANTTPNTAARKMTDAAIAHDHHGSTGHAPVPRSA